MTERIKAVLVAHERYQYRAQTREFVCKCGTVIAKSYPDTAHRDHLAAEIAAMIETGVMDDD